jgi:cytochrome c553
VVDTQTLQTAEKSIVKTGFRVLLPLLILAAPAGAQDAAAGEALYGPCAACHGPAGGGSKDLNAPAIAGQEEWYLVRQLQNFKSGARGAHAGDTYGMQMAPMAQTLASDTDIANLAAYVAGMAPVAVTHDGGGEAAAGQALYAPCAACHGPAGEGMQAMNAPNLTLQQDWYVVRQLMNFKSGVRGSGAGDAFGAQMVPMAATVADEQAAKNLAAYIATLGG